MKMLKISILLLGVCLTGRIDAAPSIWDYLGEIYRNLAEAYAEEQSSSETDMKTLDTSGKTRDNTILSRPRKANETDVILRTSPTYLDLLRGFEEFLYGNKDYLNYYIITVDLADEKVPDDNRNVYDQVKSMLYGVIEKSTKTYKDITLKEIAKYKGIVNKYLRDAKDEYI